MDMHLQLRAMALIKAAEYYIELANSPVNRGEIKAYIRETVDQAVALRHRLTALLDAHDATEVDRMEKEWLRKKDEIEDKSLMSVGEQMIAHIAKEVSRPMLTSPKKSG